jgi:TonB family protein
MRRAGQRGRGQRVLLLLAASALFTGAARAEPDAPPPEGSPPSAAIVPPKLLTFVPAEFPPSEIAAGRGATVVLELSIDAGGRVVKIAVVGAATPAFDAAAVAAAGKLLFSPAMAGGSPIPATITYRTQFTLTETLVKKRASDFGGLVRDRKTKLPLGNVRVALDTGQGALTDADGRFSILDVAPGDHAVTLSGEAIATVGTRETFAPSQRLDATYDVDMKKVPAPGEDDEEQIVVTAPRLRKQVVSTEVRATQAQKVPGTQGDVLKVVENLPGVARASVGSGALLVWGAAPQDTRVYVDGIHVPRLYHDGGYRSILPSDFVRSVELLPGGYGAGYGRGLGGVVAVTSLPLEGGGLHGSAGADIIEASGDVRGELGHGVHAAFGIRRSYLDAVLPAVTTADVGDFVPIPRYWDGQARVAFDLAPHETVELGALASSDRLEHTLVNEDPALTTRQTTSTEFARTYVRYQRRTGDGVVVTAMPWVGFDRTSLVNLFGATPTEVADRSTVAGLRADWQGKLTERLRGNVGLDAEGTFSRLHRAGSIGAPPREGDVFVFGQPPPAEVTVDDWKTTLLGLGAYGALDAALLDGRLHVDAGLRFEPTLIVTNKTVPSTPLTAVGHAHEEDAVDPRLSLRYALTSRLTTKVAFGRYHQSPQPEDLSALFGTPTLVPSTAEHYLAGAGLALNDTLSLEATAFLIESHDLPVRSQAESPFVAHALDQIGRGRSYGGQIFLRQQQRGRFFGWLTYTLMRSERKDAPDLPWRLFDYDQTHVFTAVGSLDLGRGFEVGARFRFASGYPRTPVEGSYFDTRTNAYEPIFGAHNTTRIPPFVAVDVRAAKRFKVQRWRGECYLDLQNATNRKNPEEIVYNTTFTQRGTISGMPILPVLGARVAW